MLASQMIIATAAKQQVVAESTDDDVVAGTAVDDIVQIATEQYVVAVAAFDGECSQSSALLSIASFDAPFAVGVREFVFPVGSHNIVARLAIDDRGFDIRRLKKRIMLFVVTIVRDGETLVSDVPSQ